MSRRSTQALIKVQIAAIVVLLLAVLALGKSPAGETGPAPVAECDSP